MDPLPVGADRFTATVTRDNRHDLVYMFGAICPDREVGAAIYHAGCQYRGDERASEGDQHTGAAERACRADLRRRRLASAWQEAESSGHITLLPLPPYSPELNSMAESGTICVPTS